MRRDSGFRVGSSRYAGIVSILAVICYLFFSAIPSFSRDVTFVWTANPENVDGYRIYYKTGSSGTPYNGTGSLEGPSPVSTGNVTSFTLHGLSDTETYYFALTAYLGAEQSGYSTELTLPASTGSTGRNVTFAWTANPENVDGYKLYYKTGSSGAPYDGTGVTEGGSPIDTGNVTTFTLHNLSETETYYFSLTAYVGTQESGYAEELSLGPSQSNTPPTASGSTVSAIEDASYAGQLIASDVDGDSLTYTLVANGTRGNVVITNSSTGAFTYTPNSNVNGTDSFTFVVNDGTADSSTATVTISIAAVNDQPTVSNSSLSTVEDTPANGQLSGSDIDGDSLTYSIVTNGSKGRAVITGFSTGAFVYTPNENENGSDSFTFRVNDGTANSAAATVSVSIAAVNDPPTATGAAAITDENTALQGQLLGADPDGDSLTFSIVTNGGKGSAIITQPTTGNFTYTPNTNEYGSDTFTFKVNDGKVDSTTATMSLTINLVNAAPVPANISVTTDMNTEYIGYLQAYDSDDDVLTYSIVTNGIKGNATITDTAAGAFRYTPNVDESGEDSFTFRVNDGLENSIEGTVSVRILDGTTLTAVFGDNYGADYPGTVADTFANVNTSLNSSAETLRTYAQSASAPHRLASTIIMKIDVSDIPTYATIIEAKLILFQSSAVGEALYKNSVHKIMGKNPVIAEVTGFNAANGQTWTPVTAGETYNNIPLGVGDIDQMEDEQHLFVQPESRSWKITSMVQDWVALPSTNYGLLLKGEESTTETGRIFAASENNNTAIRPQVIVYYKLIPRPPQLILIEEIK